MPFTVSGIGTAATYGVLSFLCISRRDICFSNPFVHECKLDSPLSLSQIFLRAMLHCD